MPIQDMKDQVDFEMDVSIHDVYRFCRIREQIRINRKTFQSDWLKGLDLTEREADVLTNSRMNNIFRDHDKVTQCLWSKVHGMSDDRELWRNLMIGRFINRIDRIDDVFPLTDNWFEKAGWTEKTPLVNSSAYQLNPGLGKAFGVKRVREVIPLLDQRVDITYEALVGSSSIKEAVEKTNTAFGGYSLFVFFQAILDFGMFRPNVISLSSTSIEGQGAHATLNALDMSLSDVISTANQLWPEHRLIRPEGLYEFDAENIMCEFRKFMKRQGDGIPQNRRYKRLSNTTLNTFWE